MSGTKQFLNGFKKGMRDFGHSISIIINTLLLSLVYLIGVGITSILAKLYGKHFLETKRKNGTYWKDLNLKKKNIENYYKQF